VIFAGNFAQLPLVHGHALYKREGGRQIQAWMTAYSQKQVIGKAMWHQATTVVLHYVSVITSRNAQRDQLNEMGHVQLLERLRRNFTISTHMI
ncbi:hypothetical protein C8J56DRAFT_784180, partial [Mycena floridula]